MDQTKSRTAETEEPPPAETTVRPPTPILKRIAVGAGSRGARGGLVWGAPPVAHPKNLH